MLMKAGPDGVLTHVQTISVVVSAFPKNGAMVIGIADIRPDPNSKTVIKKVVVAAWDWGGRHLQSRINEGQW